MLQITRVDIVDGQTLDIELNNGHLILFDTQRLPETDHSYDNLRNLEVLPRPNTDGQSIFWRDGPRITLEEILHWLSMQIAKSEEDNIENETSIETNRWPSAFNV